MHSRQTPGRNPDMADRSTAHLARILLATALLLPLMQLLPLSAHAQSGQLYRVELLVFSQPSGAAAEHWDATPELAYPKNTRFLIYPGEQVAAPSPLPTPPIPDGTAAVEGSAPPGPVQPTLFATLDQGQRQLAGMAAAMQRSGRYRILFHEAWIQPVSSQTQALPIVLDRSGDGGAWPALQGTIKLYLSRYLYLDTNLWLNTQGEYLQGSWRMPAPPLAPVSSARETAVYKQAGQPGATASTEPSLQPAVADTGITAASDEALGPDYPFRHAVLLKQTRRLRSGEIVYVDHPLLGVLIRIGPIASADEGHVE